MKASIKAKYTTKMLPSNFFSLFKKDAKIIASKVAMTAADQLMREAREIILKQRYKWVPLSDEYLNSKIRKGLDRRILIATRDYVNKGIGVWKAGGYVFVGPKPGIHRPSGLTYQVLAMIHEFGTNRIPARPLWRPLLSVALRRNKSLRNLYLNALRQAYVSKAKLETKTYTS